MLFLFFVLLLLLDLQTTGAAFVEPADIKMSHSFDTRSQDGGWP